MIIRVSQLRAAFLGMVLFYYSGFMSFSTGLLGNRIHLAGQSDVATIDESAAGNLVRQWLGVAIFILGIYFIRRLRDRSLGTFVYRHLFWLLLLAFSIASVAWSVEPGVSLRRIVSLLIVFVSALVLLYQYQLQFVLECIGRVLGWAALVGLIYALAFPHQGFIQGGLREGALLGIFTDKNAGARCYVYGLLIFFGLRLYRSRLDKLLLAALIAAVILSNSASAVLMTLGGLGLMLVFNASRVIGNPQKTFNRLIFVALCLLLAALTANHFYEQILLALGRDPTLTNRTLIWRLIDPVLQARPWLGYGFGAFWASPYVEYFVKVWGFIGNAHNGYIESRLNGGYAGLGILLLLFVTTFWRIARACTLHPESPLFSLLASILLIQAGVNYIGFIIPNQVTLDMLVFSIIVVGAGKYGLSRALSASLEPTKQVSLARSSG